VRTFPRTRGKEITHTRLPEGFGAERAFMPSRESPKFKKTLQAVHLKQTKQTGIGFGIVGCRVEFKKTLQAVHLNKTHTHTHSNKKGLRLLGLGFQL